MGEKFIASTAEHNTWGQIAEIYRELLGLQYEWVDKEDYLRIMSKNQEQISPFVRYQLEFARMFDRITDNSKILRVTGMKQEDLTTFYDGMKMELSKLSPETLRIDAIRAGVNERMDAYFANRMKK